MEEALWPQRFVIGYPPANPKNPGTVEYDMAQMVLGMQLAAHMAEKRNEEVSFLFDSIKHVSNDSTINRVLERSALSRLQRGDSVACVASVRMRLVVPKTRLQARTSVVLAVHPTVGLLDSLHGNPNEAPSCEFVVPWWSEAYESWGDVFGYAEIVDQEQTDFPPLEIVDQRVRETVDEIIKVYKGTGHKSDEQAIRKQFASLRTRKREIDGRAIRAHVLRESFWTPVMADDLVKIAVGRKKQA